MTRLKDFLDVYHACHSNHHSLFNFWLSLTNDEKLQHLSNIQSDDFFSDLSIELNNLHCKSEVQLAYFEDQLYPISSMIPSGQRIELTYTDPERFIPSRAIFWVNGEGKVQATLRGIDYVVYHPMSWDSESQQHYINYQQLMYVPNIPAELESRYKTLHKHDIHYVIKARDFTTLLKLLEHDSSRIRKITMPQWHKLLTDLRENNFIYVLVSNGNHSLINNVLEELQNKIPNRILKKMLTTTPAGQRSCAEIFKSRFHDDKRRHFLKNYL